VAFYEYLNSPEAAGSFEKFGFTVLRIQGPVKSRRGTVAGASGAPPLESSWWAGSTTC